MNNNSNTVAALRRSVESDRVIESLLSNFTSRAETIVWCNEIYITYNFDDIKIIVEYLFEMRMYPNIELSFEEFKKFLSDCRPSKQISHAKYPKTDLAKTRSDIRVRKVGNKLVRQFKSKPPKKD